MTLKSVLRSAGLSLTAALSCNNIIKAHILVMTGEQLLALFPEGSAGSLELQRNDAARLKTRKASHIMQLQNRPDTQSEFRAVWFDGELKILDGNHRIRAWHEQVHLRMANVSLKIYEPNTVEQVEALYASIDSRKNAKGSQDELWSIFNFAEITDMLTSEEMTTGKNLATVMKHFLPGKGIAARGLVARRKQRALRLADSLFNIIKNVPKTGVDRKLSEVFGGGELLAILELYQSYVDKDIEKGIYHLEQVVVHELKPYIEYALDGSRGMSAPEVTSVFEEYEENARLAGHKRTGEKVVVARAAILKPMLEAFVASRMKPARRARVAV
ncbi:hypothetical protein WJ97_14080 [Burkholderia ubonensis]|uniref:hypothetical protein n=1 Tax=Burkholderia ubonensis TaxID=101571 RepID=UPI000759D15A|nr:hypothetical protein [Burkholderia ubonensis]KVP96945.1 hypothetical protein WJ97_14080 [Burkholderia ubonensis]